MGCVLYTHVYCNRDNTVSVVYLLSLVLVFHKACQILSLKNRKNNTQRYKEKFQQTKYNNHSPKIDFHLSEH